MRHIGFGSVLAILLAACTGSPAPTPQALKTESGRVASSATLRNVSRSAAPSTSVSPSSSAKASATAFARRPSLDPAPKLRGGGARAVRSEHGLVVSVEAHATRAGVRILEAGGNAVDAAIAVGYALAVTHPSAGNLGGGGLLLVRPAQGPTTAIDFREAAPAAITSERFSQMLAHKAVGPAAAGVPGTVAGLNLAHERFGRLPLSQVIDPAIRLARDGFRLGDRQAMTIAWAWSDLVHNPAARIIYGDHGQPRKAGTRLVQPDLANTLARIAKDGTSGFYDGVTAKAIVASMKSEGFMTLADLSAYHASVRDPLRVPYRGLTVEVAPPPSAGGVAVAQMLLLRERYREYRYPEGSADELHFFIESARRAYATRRLDVVDPESVQGYDLMAKEAEWLDEDRLLSKYPAIDPEHATPSSSIDPLYPKLLQELEHTTHFAVVDADGMVVSCTTTLSAGFGAKFVAAGTGVVLNNSLAAFGSVGVDLPLAHRKMGTSMSPTLVLDGDKPVAVLGSPGGDTIPNTVVQVLRNIVDYSMTVDDAVDAPRVHHGFVPDEVRFEQKRPPPKKVLEALAAKGHHFSSKRSEMGDANSIVLVDGVAWGYPDPREGGLALGLPVAPSPPAASNAGPK